MQPTGHAGRNLQLSLRIWLLMKISRLHSFARATSFADEKKVPAAW